MSQEFAARRLDVKSFVQEAGSLRGEEPLREHERLMAETQGRGSAAPVTWAARGELKNAAHVQPEIWLHLEAKAVLALTCQRCLGPVDVELAVNRSFRFVDDEDLAAAQDEDSEEDVLALSRSFDLVELVEDELLMEMPLAPRHGVCPVPVRLATADDEFEPASRTARDNPFAILDKLKKGKT
jgi:uncharacterized protein